MGYKEDSGLEQGYHNKPFSVLALSYTQPPHCPYQMKKPFEAIKLRLAVLQSAGAKKGKIKMRSARSKDV